ncbi:hypothetical protein [Dulcicalothrix desertica]|uniref:hypothetical protein n=1 Tax=Dulcicalothrix desertica TaxID=32056 RepID=UPI001F173D1C|nr:hypothetical protein [Dulcicalothrix desertica]
MPTDRSYACEISDTLCNHCCACEDAWVRVSRLSAELDQIFSLSNNQRVRTRPKSTSSAAWSMSSFLTISGTVHSIKYLFSLARFNIACCCDSSVKKGLNGS